MLATAHIPIDFWRIASQLNADLIYTGRTDEAVRDSHWTPGHQRAYVYILSSAYIPCYIGKSFDPHRRFTFHRHRDWWGEAEHLTVFQVTGESHGEAGQKALCLEAAAIRYMRPIYNIAGVV